MLTQSWYNSDSLEGVWSLDSQPHTPGSPESPLSSSSHRREERDGEGEGEREGYGMEGPLVPALLSKLERLLDQVYTVHKCVTREPCTCMYMYIHVLY